MTEQGGVPPYPHRREPDDAEPGGADSTQELPAVPPGPPGWDPRGPQRAESPGYGGGQWQPGPPQYGEAQYGEPQYGEPGGYGSPPYGRPDSSPYGQPGPPPYGPPGQPGGYGPSPYGQPGEHGQPGYTQTPYGYAYKQQEPAQYPSFGQYGYPPPGAYGGGQAPPPPRKKHPVAWGAAIGLVVVICAAVAVSFFYKPSWLGFKTVFDPTAVESTIRTQSNGTYQSVSCPSGQPATKGTTFQCTASNGQKIDVRVTDDTGNYVWAPAS